MKRGTLKNIATFCRITPQHLSDVLGRRKKPSARLAVVLEEYTSVSRVLWVWGSRAELREALENVYDKDGHGV
ncbi:MAG: hypothetical protein WBB19_01135 [Desulforhopalus sp.]